MNLNFNHWVLRPSQSPQISLCKGLEVATMLVHAINSTWIQISVLIVSNLAVLKSVRTYLHTIPYQQRLPLAHLVTEDQNFEISIFNGTEYYWYFIQNTVMDHLRFNHISFQVHSSYITVSKTSSMLVLFQLLLLLFYCFTVTSTEGLIATCVLQPLNYPNLPNWNWRPKNCTWLNKQ